MENTTNNTQPVTKEIKLSELAVYVNEGKKKEDIMEIYGLNSAQVGKLMKEAGLTFRKFHKPAFTLIRDISVETEVENNLTENQEVTSEDWR